MDIVESKLIFLGYKVKEITYRLNEKFKCYDNVAININPSMGIQIGKNTENDYVIELSITIDGSKGIELPFDLIIRVTGCFRVEEQIEDKDRTLIEENAVAILFPYLRAIVTSVTASANIPPYILPTMNIVEMFKQEKEAQKAKDLQL